MDDVLDRLNSLSDPTPTHREVRLAAIAEIEVLRGRLASHTSRAHGVSDDHRALVLRFLAGNDGIFTHAGGGATKALASAAGITEGKYGSVIVGRLDSLGLIDRLMPSPRMTTAVRLTSTGWAEAVGVPRPPVDWPIIEVSRGGKSRRAPVREVRLRDDLDPDRHQPSPLPAPRRPPKPLPDDPAAQRARLERVAAAWNACDLRTPPAQRINAVRSAAKVTHARAAELVLQAREFGLIPSLPSSSPS